MAQAINQFYYVDNGKPILKTEYDDGSEDFYDASGQFGGQSWSHLGNGTVIDPYGDMAQQEADRQRDQPVFRWPNESGTGKTELLQPDQGYVPPAVGYAPPAQPQGAQSVPNPLSQTRPRYLDPNPEANPAAAAQYSPPGAAQAPSAVQSAAPVGANANPAAASGPQTTDPRVGQNMTRYDWAGNPRQAMLNAMADVGGYQLTNNPYVDRLLSAAPGMATSFMAQRGLGGAGPDTTGQSYSDFGQFLRQALQGGNIFSTVGSTTGQFPQITQAVRGFNQAGAAGGDAANPVLQNPFIRQLAAMFGADNNQGALGTYGQLLSPFLSGAQQRPFSDMMEARYTNASRGFDQGGDVNRPGYGGNDWWKYLFGQ